MNGLLFPGQGSQSVGMGKALYEQSSGAKKLLDQANNILGYDLRRLMFEGPLEDLTDTKYAQPAIYTCSAMYLHKVKNNRLDYHYVAGHSLGEYNALLAAGVFDFETGLELVVARGDAMSQMNGKGTMAAVLGLEENELKPYLVPDVVMANLNAKTQIVISGTHKGVNEVEINLKKLNGIKFKALNVSAAFHSPQMEKAAEIMGNLIEEAHFQTPSCYVISNVTGKPTKDLEEIKGNLLAQITGQVRWYDTIMAMKNAGVTMLYEIGNGDVLKKLNKTITFRPKCISIGID